MAWQMPGQWNPGVAQMPQMTPDMNMGSYTPEQWAVVQQQNWQQWTQWQQQYSQWQSQYGEKYAQQMQTMQMGMVPPLPPSNTAPPPAPPPPKEQPPPPPHENNQPLFGQPIPVPAPGLQKQTQNTGISNNNINIATGSTQNWQQGTEPTNQPTVNAEALKKLAEEERLFDIQFEKWEEEIHKWKRENVNHPDRQAYREYEQKFETCRAQLLERRQVMKQKRARLLGQPVPAASSGLTGNTSTTQPPKQTSNNSNNPILQSQSNNSLTGQTNNQYIQQELSQNNYRSNNNKMLPQNFNNMPPQNYSNSSQYPHAKYNNNMQSQGGYNRGINKNVDPQDQFESYNNQDIDDYESQNVEKQSFSTPISSTDFLPGSGSAKSIPGLDLVPEVKDSLQPDVIDITEDKTIDNQVSGEQAPPDYTTISKGINNILGDEKIMNILNMVRDHGVPPPAINKQGSYGQNKNQNSSYNNVLNTPNALQSNQWDRNLVAPNQQQYGNTNMPFNRQGPGYPNQLQDAQQYPPQRRMNNDAENNNISMDQYNDGNMQGQNMQSREPPMRPNMPNMSQPRPLMQNMQEYQRDNDYLRRPPPRGPDNMGPMRPNMPPPRPLMECLPSQDNENDYARGPHDNRRLHSNMANQGMNNQCALPPPPPSEPARPKWKEEPLFTPSIIVEYEHKPLRLKAREFIEPVHMFDYNHKSKDNENNKKRDFEREVDELFQRKPRRFEPEEVHRGNRFGSEDAYKENRFASEDTDREYIPRDFERRYPREELRNDHREFRDDRDFRGPPREEFDDRRRPDERNDDRRRDDRDRHARRDETFRREEFTRRDEFPRRDELGRRDEFGRRDEIGRRDEFGRRDEIVRQDEFGRRDDIPRRDEFARRDDLNRDRGRDREDSYRDRQRDRRDDTRNRSRSRDRDSRKRGRSRESTISESSTSKKSKEPEKKEETPKHIVMIDDILEPPGREMRPEKIVIILRGPPGSGKSYLAKLIRDREAEHGGTARIMSIDDYFMQEGEIEEKDPTTGKTIKKPSLKYEYEAKSEETYLNSLKRAFKRSLTDGYFNFLIYDAVNDTLRSYADIWNFARQQGFQVYICTMELDWQICFKRNIHGRTLGEIQVICTRFFPTPDHHIQLDATTLLQSGAITEVTMEDIDDEVEMEDAQDPEVESSFTSKWEKLDDAVQLARLDGTSKPLRPSQLSMEDYLQLDDWKPSTAKPGKKTVRWADIEESRQQEKMRAIGFVVGQTDWNRMTDPTKGSGALTQTKYIERVKRN